MYSDCISHVFVQVETYSVVLVTFRVYLFLTKIFSQFCIVFLHYTSVYDKINEGKIRSIFLLSTTLVSIQ